MTREITKVRKHFYRYLALRGQWIVDIVESRNIEGGYVRPDGTAGGVYGYDSKAAAEAAEALYLAKNAGVHNGIETSAGEVCKPCRHFDESRREADKCSQAIYRSYLSPDAVIEACGGYEPKVPTGEGEIRKFDTGATRDTVEGKLDYVKALCPLVLRRYVQYLDKHRLQPDGSMRDFDNWKKGIPRETYHSSKGRHFFADWLLEEGYEVSDNHGPVDEEVALCGELFNTMGKLREILRAKENKK